jgi:hypothetical protein
MSDLRTAAQQALEALETVFMPHHPAVIALRAALAEEALQRLSDANQEIEAVLAQPEQEPKWRLSCGCPSQHGGILAEWPEITREGDPAVVYGTLCERHWHEYEARCPNCASLEAQNTELDRKLAELERNA